MLTHHERYTINEASARLRAALHQLQQAIETHDRSQADAHIGQAFGEIGESERQLGIARASLQGELPA